MKKTINGPGGLRLDLDSAEIFPDDPGQGTPAMVHLLNASSTFWWACGEGTILNSDGRELDLSITQKAWLDEQEATVDAFMDANS